MKQSVHLFRFRSNCLLPILAPMMVEPELAPLPSTPARGRGGGGILLVTRKNGFRGRHGCCCSKLEVWRKENEAGHFRSIRSSIP
jgi:hypothetical protein